MPAEPQQSLSSSTSTLSKKKPRIRTRTRFGEFKQQIEEFIKTLRPTYENKLFQWQYGELVRLINEQLTLMETKLDEKHLLRQKNTDEVMDTKHHEKHRIRKNEVAGLIELLAQRPQDILHSPIDYTRAPNEASNTLYLVIAQLLESITKLNRYQLLMPQLSNDGKFILENDLFADTTQLRHFVLSDDGKTPIFVFDCLQIAAEDGLLRHTNKLTEEGQTCFLSETEARRVINHSAKSKEYYDAVKALLAAKNREGNYGTMLKMLANGLRAGSEVEIKRINHSSKQAVERLEKDSKLKEENRKLLGHKDVLSKADDTKKIKVDMFARDHTYESVFKFTQWLDTLPMEEQAYLLKLTDYSSKSFKSMLNNLLRLRSCGSFISAVKPELNGSNISTGEFDHCFVIFKDELYFVEQKYLAGRKFTLVTPYIIPDNIVDPDEQAKAIRQVAEFSQFFGTPEEIKALWPNQKLALMAHFPENSQSDNPLYTFEEESKCVSQTAASIESILIQHPEIYERQEKSATGSIEYLTNAISIALQQFAQTFKFVDYVVSRWPDTPAYNNDEHVIRALMPLIKNQDVFIDFVKETSFWSNYSSYLPLLDRDLLKQIDMEQAEKAISSSQSNHLAQIKDFFNLLKKHVTDTLLPLELYFFAVQYSNDHNATAGRMEPYCTTMEEVYTILNSPLITPDNKKYYYLPAVLSFIAKKFSNLSDFDHFIQTLNLDDANTATLISNSIPTLSTLVTDYASLCALMNMLANKPAAQARYLANIDAKTLQSFLSSNDGSDFFDFLETYHSVDVLTQVLEKPKADWSFAMRQHPKRIPALFKVPIENQLRYLKSYSVLISDVVNESDTIQALLVQLTEESAQVKLITLLQEKIARHFEITQLAELFNILSVSCVKLIFGYDPETICAKITELEVFKSVQPAFNCVIEPLLTGIGTQLVEWVKTPEDFEAIANAIPDSGLPALLTLFRNRLAPLFTSATSGECIASIAKRLKDEPTANLISELDVEHLVQTASQFERCASYRAFQDELVDRLLPHMERFTKNFADCYLCLAVLTPQNQTRVLNQIIRENRLLPLMDTGDSVKSNVIFLKCVVLFNNEPALTAFLQHIIQSFNQDSYIKDRKPLESTITLFLDSLAHSKESVSPESAIATLLNYLANSEERQKQDKDKEPKCLDDYIKNFNCLCSVLTMCNEEQQQLVLLNVSLEKLILTLPELDKLRKEIIGSPEVKEVLYGVFGKGIAKLEKYTPSKKQGIEWTERMFLTLAGEDQKVSTIERPSSPTRGVGIFDSPVKESKEQQVAVEEQITAPTSNGY